MSLLQQALVAFGNRETMPSGELMWKLDPDYRQKYTTRATAGYHLSKELGVRPHRWYDSTRQRWRSEYHRADLEAAASVRNLTAEPEEVRPTLVVSDDAVKNLTAGSIDWPEDWRCKCGEVRPPDRKCWRCGSTP